jgi:Zn ribbon nucleic-acid-binding protein
MNEGKFTAKAAVLWSTIPKEARERILAAVFCVKCRTSVTITKFTGEEKNGDVVLKGACAKCGHEVVRVVETSEEDRSGN